MVKKKGGIQKESDYDRKKQKNKLRKRKNTIKKKVNELAEMCDQEIFIAIQDKASEKMEVV